MTDWQNHVLTPDWPAPSGVRALVTTRLGGCSKVPFDSFNTATLVGDDPSSVAANRALLRTCLPAEPAWLKQVHGVVVVDAATVGNGHAAGDASVAFAPGIVCVVQTADCLPVLFARDDGSAVGAAHAGWRGLCHGVLEETVARLGDPARLLAWLGPAIGPDAFEVGEEVRDAFMARDGNAINAFVPGTIAGKWLANIYMLARQRLLAVGVIRVYGGGLCTVSDAYRFYSYRRDRVCGLMASLIWLEDSNVAHVGSSHGTPPSIVVRP